MVSSITVGQAALFGLIIYLIHTGTSRKHTPHDDKHDDITHTRHTNSGVSCSLSKPCEAGCCGPLDKHGMGRCGGGPAFCGKGCSSQCGWKSPCDPGWGMTYAAASTCPLKACCSAHGFCGITEAFCQGREVDRPSCDGKSASANANARAKRIGYYQAWNHERPCQSMTPEQIPAGSYTHINFAFALIDPETFKVADMNPQTAALYKPVLKLKKTQPGLQVWLSVGGGAMGRREKWKGAFSRMARTEDSQDAFVDSLVRLVDVKGFDGVDLDWEYPADAASGGAPADVDNMVKVCKKLRRRLRRVGKGLSVTLPMAYKYLRGFDLEALQDHVDWFNLMTYDFQWEGGASGSRAYAHTNQTGMEMRLDVLWTNGIKPHKVVMGMAFYGRSFTISDPDCRAAGCESREAGRPGNCTRSPGLLSAREIKQIIKSPASRAQVGFDEEAAVKTLAWDTDQWVGYDDAETLRMKLEYANSRCLAGTMAWSVDMDDGSLARALASSSQQ